MTVKPNADYTVLLDRKTNGRFGKVSIKKLIGSDFLWYILCVHSGNYFTSHNTDE